MKAWSHAKRKRATRRTEKFVYGTDLLRRYRFPTHVNELVIDRSESRHSEVFMVVLESQEAPPLHKHDENEQIFYIISGSGVLTIGNKKEKFIVSPGDVVRIPLATYHSIKADKGVALRYLCVDCFGVKPESEPTWDDHVRAMCRNNRWDYGRVIGKGSRRSSKYA